MGLLRSVAIPQGPEASQNPYRGGWQDHVVLPTAGKQSSVFKRLPQVIAFLFLHTFAAAALAQPARFDSVPPVPSVCDVPSEAIPEQADPSFPLEYFTDAFAKHHGSLQVLGGAYFCPVGLGPHVTPRFNFAPIDVRLGCMLYSPCPDDCWLRGNIEGILELTTAPVLGGPGSIVIGPNLLLRYNFVQPDCRVIPYLQCGGGFIYNDAYRDKTQRALGQAGEFYLQTNAGLHFMVGPRCSIDAEGGYIHISNAGTNARNGGINALGGSLGVTYFFGKHYQ